ncbi:uncharacterized protein LOC119971551 isoform X2 [Scyliorhinus canicula]|uniref:uncharacterized protein LOC119971551 isoform X2 n=1 Tax=Scyliorhinus canicula TaxID=7830 RepID=UPI0018F418B4|nr:uncharacterized protein LOC119971551 isoform X2 [Scyliorhinus canicula]
MRRRTSPYCTREYREDRHYRKILTIIQGTTGQLREDIQSPLGIAQHREGWSVKVSSGNQSDEATIIQMTNLNTTPEKNVSDSMGETLMIQLATYLRELNDRARKKNLTG